VQPVAKLKVPVTLSAIKANPALAEMDLMRLSRLSVSAVRAAEWDIVLEMAGGTV
jgi:predicted RNA-binding protein with PUA-like domain